MSPFLSEKSWICTKTFFINSPKFTLKKLLGTTFYRNDKSNFLKASQADDADPQ